MAQVFVRKVMSAYGNLKVAGLCDPAKRNWYGIDLKDVIVNAAKLGVTPAEMRTILRDAPWAAGCPIGRPWN